MQCFKDVTAVLASASALDFQRDETGKISHITAFLYHTGLNKNGVELTEAIGDLSAPGFINMDFIATPNLDHDVFMDGSMPGGGVFSLNKSVDEYRQASKNYSLGKIIDIIKKPIAVANQVIPSWRVVIKLTNDKFRDELTKLSEKYRDIKDAKLRVSSFFVGRPKILASANGKQTFLYDSPVTAIHLALVKSPAYEDEVSLISGLCMGEDGGCSKNLAAASSNSLVSEFNNQLLDITKMLYASANTSDNMAEEPKQDNNKAPVATPAKEEPKQDNNELIKLQTQVAELTKKLEEKEKPEDKKEEPKEDNEKDATIAKLNDRIAKMERDRSIAEYMDKLKAIPNLDVKAAKKQAEIFVDKNYTAKEVDEFITSFAPMIKASASSEDKKNKERELDAIVTNYMASASTYDPANATDEQKKARNRDINLGAIEHLLPYLK